MPEFTQNPLGVDHPGSLGPDDSVLTRSNLSSVNEILDAGIDPRYREKYMTRATSPWRLGMLLDPEGKHSARFGIPFHPPAQTVRSNDEVIELLKEARRNKWKLAIEVNLRGIDGPGSSQDLLRFQVKLTTTGDEIGRMFEMPCTTAVASEFHARFEVELADEGDEEKIVYEAPPRLGGRHERTILNDAEELRNDHGLIEMRDVPAYTFSRYFGINRGVKVTCSPLEGMALEGGLESSNAFTNSISIMGSMLSGHNWSLAKNIRQSVYDENTKFGHLTPGITGGQGTISSSVGDAATIEWLSGLGGRGILDDESYIYENDTYGAVLFPLNMKEGFRLQDRVFLCQPGKEYLPGGEVKRPRLASDTNFEWTREWDDPVGQRLHNLKKDLHYIWRCALEEGDDEAAAYALNTQTLIRCALNDRYKEWSPATGEVADPNVRYLDEYSEALFKAVQKVGGGTMPAGAGGCGSICIVYLPECVDSAAFFEELNIRPFDEDKAIEARRDGGMYSGYLPFAQSREGLRLSEGWGKLKLPPPAGPQLVALNEETGQMMTLEGYFGASGIAIPFKDEDVPPEALRGGPVEIEAAKRLLRECTS